MTIETVKIAGDGYLVNGAMSVPASEGNRHYQAVLEWLETNTAEPEFTAEELAFNSQAEINAEALDYLARTDWYVIRFQETGVLVPPEVALKREESRAAVV